MATDLLTELILSTATVVLYSGVILIIIFIALILFSKNSKTIEGYFFAVASNSFFDLSFTLISAVIKLGSMYTDGYYVYTVNMFDYEMDPGVTKALILAWIFLGNMCTYSLVVPFYVRYSLVYKTKNVHFSLRTLLYSFLFIYEVIIITFFHWALEVSPPELANIHMRSYLKGNDIGRYWNFAAAKVVSLESLL